MLQRYRRLRAENRGLFCFHLLLRVAVACLLGWKLFLRQWSHVGLCVLTLALFGIPALAEAVHLAFPPLLEVIITLFALCANIGGELFELYLLLPWWDAMLHLLWGFLGAVFGCAFLKMALRNQVTPLAALMGALGFSALTSVCWELFEYFMDVVFCMDMQKSMWLDTASSLLLNPAGTNRTVTVEAESVIVNGTAWPGLLDIGLRDTMSDLLLNLLGSIAAAVLVMADARPGRKGRLLRLLMPTLRPGQEKGTDREKI